MFGRVCGWPGEQTAWPWLLIDQHIPHSQPRARPKAIRILTLPSLAESSTRCAMARRPRRRRRCSLRCLSARSRCFILARGLNNQDIANELHLSWSTMCNQMSTILDKLDVEDRTQAALLAQRHGLTQH